jgi:hypothetical protein
VKPILDISNKNSFTVWESCVWRDSFSSSVIVGDQQSNKMQVIYDRDPTRSATHALFYANVDSILAGCFISKPTPRFPNSSLLRLELVRIESLTTKTVQGNTIPDAKLAPLFLTSAAGKLDFEKGVTQSHLDELLKSFSDLPSLPNARSMLEQAVTKAMTPPAQQRLFWGIPRQKIEQDY